MLQVKHLTITHKKDLPFAVRPGDRIAIIGEEGNGKSTLLKLLYDETLVFGYIEYQGEIVRENQRLGYLPQELPNREKEKTVWEFCCGYEGFYDLASARIEEITKKLGFDAGFFYSDQIVNTLYGGDRTILIWKHWNGWNSS